MSNGNIGISAKGRFGISVLDKNGKIKKEKSISNTSNVVTYSGAYQALINSTSSLFGIYTASMGTGTVEITRSATGLGSRASGSTGQTSASRVGNEVDNLDGTSTLTLSRTLSFSLGSQVGTFSEVGVYTPFDGEVFIAGQLIKDEFGNPTTITVLSDEQLVVTYILEWTVPNASQLIGTGSVTDADSNVYNYEVYSQPYFSNFAINDSYTVSRYFSALDDEVGFFAANGTTSLFNTGDVGGGFGSGTVVHDGAGTVTYTTQTITLSPAAGDFTDLVYLSFYTGNSDSAADGGVANTTTNTATSSNSSRYPLLIKFVDPISKTSSQSFSIQASFTVTL